MTDLQIGSTLDIAQLVVSELPCDCGIPAIPDAWKWTAKVQTLLPRLSDAAMAARAECDLVLTEAFPHGEQVLTHEISLREITALAGFWSDEDLAVRQGRRPTRLTPPKASADSVQ